MTELQEFLDTFLARQEKVLAVLKSGGLSAGGDRGGRQRRPRFRLGPSETGVQQNFEGRTTQ